MVLEYLPTLTPFSNFSHNPNDWVNIPAPWILWVIDMFLEMGWNMVDFRCFIWDLMIWPTLTNSWLSWNASECHHVWLLVGGLEPWNFMTFHSVGNVIIPTVTHSMIFQRGRYTTNQNSWPMECSYAADSGVSILMGHGPHSFCWFMNVCNGKSHLWMDETWGCPISGNHHFTIFYQCFAWDCPVVVMVKIWRTPWFFTIVLGKTFVLWICFCHW